MSPIDLLGGLIRVYAFLLWPYSLVIAWLGACGMGLFLASVFPATMCLAQGRMRISGRVTGWFFVGVSAGGMFLPWFIGQFFEPIRPQTTMAILLFALIGGVALLAVLVAFQVARPGYQWVTGEG